jgi:hypothetical protein
MMSERVREILGYYDRRIPAYLAASRVFSIMAAWRGADGW